MHQSEPVRWQYSMKGGLYLSIHRQEFFVLQTDSCNDALGGLVRSGVNNMPPFQVKHYEIEEYEVIAKCFSRLFQRNKILCKDCPVELSSQFVKALDPREGYVFLNASKPMQALDEILEKIPKEECIAQLFRSAQMAGHISNKTRLDRALDWPKTSNDPWLHWPKADWPHPVHWQYSSEGVYISMKITTPWDKKKERIQGFFYRFSEPREKLAGGTHGCMENEAIFQIPNSNQVTYNDVAMTFHKLLGGEKFVLGRTFLDQDEFVGQEDPRKGFSFVNF
jgi:hypothetical protein